MPMKPVVEAYTQVINGRLVHHSEIKSWKPIVKGPSQDGKWLARVHLGHKHRVYGYGDTVQGALKNLATNKIEAERFIASTIEDEKNPPKRVGKAWWNLWLLA